MMPHPPDWPLLDSSVTSADAGLDVPARRLTSGHAFLVIENLDRTDPPGYSAGSVPRGASFNGNVLRLMPDPCMPPIEVRCAIGGFDPSDTPILWRLICRYVLCRHTNAGGYRYRTVARPLEQEWRGEGRAAAFTIFGGAAPECSCQI